MKVDLSKVLEGPDGNPAIDETGKQVSLYKICSLSLFNGTKEPETDLLKLDKCWEMRASLKEGVMELKAEDLAFLKERIGRVYAGTPGVAGQARAMLDQGV